MTSVKGLFNAWKKVCQCMDKYGTPILGANEEATRYALIDPILRALGWEVDNPRYVRVECCQDCGGKPDYALLKRGKPVVYVEAKKWGTISSIKKLNNPFSTGKLDQLKNYCNSNSVKIGAFSDGGSWYIFGFSRGMTPKIIAFIDAKNAGRPDIKQLLHISREVTYKLVP